MKYIKDYDITRNREDIQFYDDGKITFNRQYKCKIINVIPYDNVSN